MKSLFLICIISCITSSFAVQKKVVCYYGTWSVWRSGLAKFQVTDINPNICTHIIYTFFGATEDGQIRHLDPYLDLPDSYGKDYIRKFIGLKAINPSVKLLAAVGGWNEGSKVFSKLSSSDATRKAFASNVVSFLLKFGFDGIDVDWEYPAQREGASGADKENFILLLTTMRQALDPHQKLLTIATGSSEKSASTSYDIPRMSALVDFVNLMSYDLHGSWDDKTGINSPMYQGPADDTEYEKSLNVDTIVRYWLSSGCPKEKLILGIPTYGRSFTLVNARNNGVGAPISGPGKIGSFVAEAGFLPFNEICYYGDQWTRHWESQQKVPYAVKDNQWVGYDDTESLAIKLDYILAYDLGGAMFWSLETDDFGNLCKLGKFPLITMAYEYMTGNGKVTSATTKATTIISSSPVTTAAKTSVTQSTPTTTKPNVFSCPSEGLFSDPNSCVKFYSCSKQLISYSFSCPTNLYFNDVRKYCDWPYNVQCNVK